MPDELVRMVDRIEILVNEAEEIVSEHPYLSKKRGFIENIGLSFSGDYSEREKSAESRLRSIFAETFGIVANLKDEMKKRGISIRNDKLGERIEEAGTPKEAILALRSVIGFLRTKLY